MFKSSSKRKRFDCSDLLTSRLPSKVKDVCARQGLSAEEVDQYYYQGALDCIEFYYYDNHRGDKESCRALRHLLASDVAKRRDYGKQVHKEEPDSNIASSSTASSSSQRQHSFSSSDDDDDDYDDENDEDRIYFEEDESKLSFRASVDNDQDELKKNMDSKRMQESDNEPKRKMDSKRMQASDNEPKKKMNMATLKRSPLQESDVQNDKSELGAWFSVAGGLTRLFCWVRRWLQIEMRADGCWMMWWCKLSPQQLAKRATASRLSSRRAKRRVMVLGGTKSTVVRLEPSRETQQIYVLGTDLDGVEVKETFRCSYTSVYLDFEERMLRCIGAPALSSANLSRLSYRGRQTIPPDEAASVDPRLLPLLRYENPESYLRSKDELGEGGFGRVYLAKDPTGRRVAVKEMHASKRDDHAMIAREIILLRDCEHPNIVAFRRAFLWRKRVTFVMEYADGGTLADMTRSLVPLDGSELAYITKYVLRGLEFLHRRNVVHRDIKADNLFIFMNSAVKIGDLGLAHEVTKAGLRHRCGTHGFMAPELMRHEYYGCAVDIWSLGSALYAAAFRAPLFNRSPLRNYFDTAFLGCPEQLPPSSFKPAALNMDSPRLFYDFLRLCLDPKPTSRATATGLLQHPFLSCACTKKRILQPLESIHFAETLGI
jgi:Protein kinase domain